MSQFLSHSLTWTSDNLKLFIHREEYNPTQTYLKQLASTFFILAQS